MKLVDYKTYYDAKNGKPLDISWNDAVEMFVAPKAYAPVGVCPTTDEKSDEYKEWKAVTDKLKKEAGYVFWGETKDGKKGKNDIINHTAIALDYDGVEHGKAFLDHIEKRLSDINYMYYSTTKSTNDLLRLRVIIPLNRPSVGDEYQALARQFISILGTDGIDRTSFEDNRAHGYTVLLKGQKYTYKAVTDKAMLDVDVFLKNELPNWKDARTWFYLPDEIKENEQITNRTIASKAKDEFVAPTDLRGWVGAFCRAIPFSKAVDKYLSNVYVPFSENRYTYKNGSSVGGVLVFDDRAAHTYHATDPAHGCRNAFEFVQAHLYGDLSEKQAKQKMIALAKADADVIAEKNRLKPIEMEVPEVCNNWLDFTEYPANDYGIAKRLNDLYNGKIGWATDAKVWLVFDGVKWKETDVSVLYGWFNEVVSIMRALSSKVKNAEDIQVISDIINYVQTTRYRDSALKALKPMVMLEKGGMDSDVYGMNTPAGYLQLRNDENYLIENSPDLHCRKQAGGGFGEDFEPDEACLNFLKTTIPEEDLYHWVHKWFGYCLTGSYSEKKILFLYGKRNNGKSALISLASNAFGDYYTIGESSMLLSTKYGNSDCNTPTPAIVKLAGTRLVLIDEMPAGRKLDNVAVKNMVGGAGMCGRELRESPINFTMRAKIIVATNDLPSLQDANDSAMRMRIRICPFSQIFTAKTADRTIEDKVKTESWKNTFIWWCYEGLKYYQAEGLDDYTGESSLDNSNLPEPMKDALNDYFRDSDETGDFLETYCDVTHDSNDFVSFSELYDMYVKEQKTSFAMSKKLFGSTVRRWMQMQGCDEGRKYVQYTNGKYGSQQRGYFGIRFFD